MDEQTQTPPDVGASEQLASEATAPAQAPVLTEEQRLEKLLRNLLKGLVAAVAIFAVVYFFGQRQSHVEQAPSIPDQTIANAEAAVRAKPNDIDARLVLAAAYAEAKRLDVAISQLQEILKVQPKNKPALLGVGELEYQRGNFDVAKIALATYVGIGSSGEFSAADPQLERANFALGLIELREGDAKNAAVHLQAALKIDAGDADAWLALGKAQMKLGASADAALSFRRAVAFVPSGWCEPYEQLADAYKADGNGDGEKFASAMVRVCNGGGSDSAEPLLDLANTEFAADALFGAGQGAEHDDDVKLAIEYYQQVLTVDRTNVAALSAISRLGGKPTPMPIPGRKS